MQITYFGHSCFQVIVNNKKILFDPFITPNELAKNVDVKTIQPDYILLSHGHFDHIADCELIAKQSGATVIASWEITEWLSKKGLEKLHPMNTGGSWIFDFGKVKCVKAEHSGGLPDGSYGGNPLGFIIESSEGNFYYAGDTALTYDMKLIGDYKKIDFSFFPIGNNFTMNVDNSIIACDFVKCNKAIGMHYDTFGYIKIDKQESVQKFAANGKELILFDIGETKNI